METSLLIYYYYAKREREKEREKEKERALREGLLFDALYLSFFFSLFVDECLIYFF